MWKFTERNVLRYPFQHFFPPICIWLRIYGIVKPRQIISVKNSEYYILNKVEKHTHIKIILLMLSAGPLNQVEYNGLTMQLKWTKQEISSKFFTHKRHTHGHKHIHMHTSAHEGKHVPLGPWPGVYLPMQTSIHACVKTGSHIYAHTHME